MEERPTWIPHWADARNSALSEEQYNEQFKHEMYFPIDHYMRHAHPNVLGNPSEWENTLVRQLRRWRVRVPTDLRDAANRVDAMDQPTDHGHLGNQGRARNPPEAGQPSVQRNMNPGPAEEQALVQQGMAPRDYATIVASMPEGRRLPRGMLTKEGRYVLKTKVKGQELANLKLRAHDDPDAQEAWDFYEDARRRYQGKPARPKEGPAPAPARPKEGPAPAPAPVPAPAPAPAQPQPQPQPPYVAKPQRGIPVKYPFTTGVSSAKRRELLQREQEGDEYASQHLEFLRTHRTESRRENRRKNQAQAVTTLSQDTEKLTIAAPSAGNPPHSQLDLPEMPAVSPTALHAIDSWAEANSQPLARAGIVASSWEPWRSPPEAASPARARSSSRPIAHSPSLLPAMPAVSPSAIRYIDNWAEANSEQLARAGIAAPSLEPWRSPSEAAPPARARSSSRPIAHSPSSQPPKKAAKKSQKGDSTSTTSKGSGRGGRGSRGGRGGRGGKGGGRGGGTGGGLLGGLFGSKKH